MRGSDERSGDLLLYVDLEDRVPAKHPLRLIRRIVNEVLVALDGEFAKIYADTARTLADPAFREQYVTRQWFEAVGNTPEEFAVYLKAEYARWERLIKLSRVSVE